MVERNILTGYPLTGLKNHFYCNEDGLNDFAYLHLKYLFSLPTKFSVNTVVGIHTKKWTWNFIPDVIKEYVKQVLSLISCEKVIEEVNERINETTFNWEYTFTVISIMINNKDCCGLIKGEVDSWLKKAFEENEVTNLLYVATLVARHCCYEKARYFHSYANWFSSLNFKNSKSFSLFFKFLTEILPHEPPLYIKIHLNKVPSAPYGCQGLLVDYILLAKTRLSDLNETEEYIGLFNDYHETTKDGQEADVARVIKHYIDTKEIVKPLLEAYILRRQYYEKVFLKQLLKVPECDDLERAQLIHKLNSMGKVPSSLFNAWTKL